MVDLSRRKTVIGMGMLAAGSGAAFSSAAFNNSVSPSSDMRVVVEEQLIVEPGIMFRDGSNADDTFDPSTVGTGPNSENLYDNDGIGGSGTEIFGGNNDDGLADITFDDVPAASANDDSNDNLSLEVATLLEVDDQIGSSSEGFIQIRNDTSESQTVAIRFEEFGPGTGGSQDSKGGAVSESDVVSIYEFYDSSDSKISSVDTGSAVADQTVAGTVTISPGNVEQVYLDYDTTISTNDIKSAAGIGGNPFDDQQGTADLVDMLRVGTDPSNTQ